MWNLRSIADSLRRWLVRQDSSSGVVILKWRFERALLAHVHARSGTVHNGNPDFDIEVGILPSSRHLMQRLQPSARPRQLVQPNGAGSRSRRAVAVDFLATRPVVCRSRSARA